MLGKAPSIPTVLCAIGVAFAAVPAQAAIGPGILPAAVAASAFAPQPSCPSALAPASGLVRQDLAAPASKMAALLGGQASRLELIAQQQAAPTLAVAEASFVSTLEPAAGPSFGIVTRARSCEQPVGTLAALTMPQVAPSLPTARKPMGEGDFLASRRVAIGRTNFDPAWDRVRSDTLPRGAARDLLAVSGGKLSRAGLAAVNSWANARIRYVEDRELYGKADYWASAEETLRRRAGDCEDIAIAKMQLLTAMGVPQDAMFLTIARDLARASDHALLVVKLDGQNWLLDNATDELLDARQSYDYRPIMSFSRNDKWLHGY